MAPAHGWPGVMFVQLAPNLAVDADATAENADGFATVPANLVKLQGYLLGGFLAGIGGAVYSHSLLNIDASTFPTATSVDIVRMVVIGGISVLSGPIIGAFYVLGIPMLPLDQSARIRRKPGILLDQAGPIGRLVGFVHCDMIIAAGDQPAKSEV